MPNKTSFIVRSGDVWRIRWKSENVRTVEQFASGFHTYLWTSQEEKEEWQK